MPKPQECQNGPSRFWDRDVCPKLLIRAEKLIFWIAKLKKKNSLSLSEKKIIDDYLGNRIKRETSIYKHLPIAVCNTFAYLRNSR